MELFGALFSGFQAVKCTPQPLVERLKPIIVETLKRPQYQARLANEEFGFLRTNAFYKECMDIAGDKYGWKKCALATTLKPG
jgi:hypothetical protein